MSESAPDSRPPVEWGAHMRVRHQGSLAIGEVISVDFEEDLVTVDIGEEMPRTWRVENVREVGPIRLDRGDLP